MYSVPFSEGDRYRGTDWGGSFVAVAVAASQSS